MTTVAVLGGTGNLGGEVVHALLSAGHRARIVSRRPRPEGHTPEADWAVVDYRSGAGLADAVRDSDSVIVATSALRDSRIVDAAARALHAAGQPDTHLVYISIVGIDRVPMPYYRAKVDAERSVTGAGLPWTILRATQFHDLAAAMMRAVARPPVMVLPKGARLQPVSAAEVGDRLATLALGEPAGRVDDLGGPEVLGVADLAAQFLAATGIRRRIVQVPIPGRMMRAVADGGLLAPDHADGVQTFAEFARHRFGPAHGRDAGR